MLSTLWSDAAYGALVTLLLLHLALYTSLVNPRAFDDSCRRSLRSTTHIPLTLVMLRRLLKCVTSALSGLMLFLQLVLQLECRKNHLSVNVHWKIQVVFQEITELRIWLESCSHVLQQAACCWLVFARLLKGSLLYDLLSYIYKVFTHLACVEALRASITWLYCCLWRSVSLIPSPFATRRKLFRAIGRSAMVHTARPAIMHTIVHPLTCKNVCCSAKATAEARHT